MKIIKVKTKDLIPYENNPRINEDAVKPVAESMKQFGFKVPIVIDTNNVVIAGHTRLKASKLLGLNEVPCIVADDLSKEQIKAFRLADNKVGEIAVWNFALLDQELAELEDMCDFGFVDEIESEIERNDLSEKIKDQYELIIEVENEIKLEKLYEEMKKRGFECRISTF